MRRSRQLTNRERWELGFFLAMVVAVCVGLTALVSLKGLPRIFAVKSAVDADSTFHTNNDDERVPMLEFGPPPAVLVSPAVNSLPVPGVRAAVAATPVAKAKLAPRVQEPEIKIYNGKEYRYVKTLRLRVTAYAPDPRCTYPYNGKTTASGLSVKTNGGRLVAADTSVIPMYSLVAVPGYAGGAGVPVLDRGGAIKGNRLDVLLPTFEKAKDWGSRMIDVKVYRPVK